MLNKSVTEFTEVLASKEAVPGGGGASALAGAIGTALGNMVGSLTTGKKKYAAVEQDIQVLMARAQELRKALLLCVEKDAEAFEPLSRAYGIPKDDPTRDEVMEKCLRNASAAPLEILELCCKAIELQQGFAEKGSVLAVSDAGTGAAICRGALLGAAINVKVNTKAMKDRDYADDLNRHVDELVEKYSVMAEDIFRGVYARFN